MIFIYSNLTKMFNSLLSSFKKTKNEPKTIANQKDEQEKSQAHSYFSIVYQNALTEEKNILYIMPKASLNSQGSFFHPQSWNIGMFEIGRPLGRGKFGHVYLAREKSTKLIVAIKVLTMKQAINSEVIGQIRREIEIHTHLNHPNILKMYGFFFDGKKIFYIMQYAPGGQLYRHLRQNKRFPEKKVAKYIKQMIGALMHIHKCNVFHRDIKPENILVCAGDQLKISDFGWSVRALTTFRKTMCGTLDYLCPEIIENKYYDWSVDIWALGVLTYELATGNAPFAAKERQQQYKNIRSVNIKYPQQLSVQIKDFMGKLLQKHPKQRMRLDEALKHPWIVKNSQQVVDS